MNVVKGGDLLRLKDSVQKENYKIMVVDDEQGIIDSLSIFLNKYEIKGFTNPLDAIETLKHEHFDLILLDFLMMPLHGDQVVEEIRKFNTEIYILLLTGHKDLAPPLETIKRLDIQGYCEKSDKFDQLMLLIESGLKSVEQMRTIKDINAKLIRQKIEWIDNEHRQEVGEGEIIAEYHLKFPLRFRCSFISRKPSFVTALVMRLAIAGDAQKSSAIKK